MEAKTTKAFTDRRRVRRRGRNFMPHGKVIHRLRPGMRRECGDQNQNERYYSLQEVMDQFDP
jgi:hypothetical protein